MCPIGFVMLGSTLQDLASSLRTASHQRMILACTRPLLVGHAVELATAQPPPTTTARSIPTPRLAQHRLRQLRARGSGAGRPRAGHGRIGRPRRPRPSQPYGCLPTAALQDLTSAGHSGRGNTQTPDAHTGRRTADTWTLRRPHRTLDIGPVDRQAWTLVARTGHRTPDAGRGRGQADEAAAGIRTSATTPSDRALGSPTVSCGRRMRRSTAHAGSAVRPPSSARQRLAGSCLVAPPGSSWRPGALLSSDDYGSSVERTGRLHPLWQAGYGTAVVGLRSESLNRRCVVHGWLERAAMSGSLTAHSCYRGS
jgi:hypothetical protein